VAAVGGNDDTNTFGLTVSRAAAESSAASPPAGDHIKLAHASILYLRPPPVVGRLAAAPGTSAGNAQDRGTMAAARRVAVLALALGAARAQVPIPPQLWAARLDLNGTLASQSILPGIFFRRQRVSLRRRVLPRQQRRAGVEPESRGL
jgi:hypothetical protein